MKYWLNPIFFQFSFLNLEIIGVLRDHAKITSREEGEGFGLFATKVHRSIREGEGVRKSPIL